MTFEERAERRERLVAEFRAAEKKARECPEAARDGWSPAVAEHTAAARRLFEGVFSSKWAGWTEGGTKALKAVLRGHLTAALRHNASR